MSVWPEVNHTAFVKSTVLNVSPGCSEFGRMCLAGNITSATGAVAAANTAVYVPFQINVPIIVAQGIVLNGAVAGNVDWGIYDRFGTRIVSIGTTAMAGATQPQLFNVTDTLLNPGTYFMAFVCSTTTTATFTRVTPASVSARACGVLQQASALPLPATATFAAPTSGTMPIFGFTTLSVA